MKRLAILQSNYIPWRGYFDIVDSVDEFMFYDVASYTKNDWRNRNQVKTHDGVRWITVPVITKDRFGQRITEAEVVDHKWVKTHLGTLTASLAVLTTLSTAPEMASAARFDAYQIAPMTSTATVTCQGGARIT